MSSLRTRLFYMVAAAALCGLSPAHALDLPTPLGDEDLQEIRAGYINAQGMQFDIGAIVTTSLNGVLALQSTLNLNDTGLTVNTQVGNLADALPLDGSSPLAALGGGTNGLVIPGGANGGQTVVVQDLSADAIRNIVINTAHNQTINQTTAITIAVPDLVQFQQNLGDTRIQSLLGAGLNYGLLNSLSH